LSIQSKQELISARIRESLLHDQSRADETGGKPELTADSLPNQYQSTKLFDLANAYDNVGTAAGKGFLNYLKQGIRRVFRPIWERQTAYNLANAKLIEQTIQSIAELRVQQTNLYLRTLRSFEEGMEGLVGLVEEEITSRDRRIEDLEKKLSELEIQVKRRDI
jgi:hypothetical protein